VTSASAFAVLIACSGLFGLTLITVARRTKEIGIRRVMGASVLNVARLINAEFLGLVLAANAVGWPAAYASMRLLLKNYAYRIPVSPLFFLVAGGMAAAVAVLTVSLHAVRVSLTNPVETLRYE
jgi:putative ABC transport system permease protein